MIASRQRQFGWMLCVWFLFAGESLLGRDDTQIDFSTQVRPILSDRCFHCHGPDADNQESSYRMDTEEELLAAIEPGDPDNSELHLRIYSDDLNEVMPPPKSNRSLSQEEKRILKLWIQQGAVYEGHWAFAPPQRPETPKIFDARKLKDLGWSKKQIQHWSQNPIDAFIARGLIEADLAPSPQADPATLLRRAALTLTGLLPSDKIQNEFAHNKSREGRFELAVDAMLDSMAYAERQTLRWLDAARYADTDGYQNDAERTNWPWRDWVIKAYHENMPFDQFTIEQLAGDMLPNATDTQKLASAFNRNHRQNNEGGALAAEFRVENVIDRVETTSTVFLALTFGCARCHDHKYDPLSQREFFQMYGYFNNIGEKGIGRGIEANPTLKTFSPLANPPADTLAAFKNAEAALKDAERTIGTRQQKWLAVAEANARKTSGDTDPKNHDTIWETAQVVKSQLQGDGKLKRINKNTILYSGGSTQPVSIRVKLQTPLEKVATFRIEAVRDKKFGKPHKLAPSSNGNFVMSEITLAQDGQPLNFSSATAAYSQPGYDVANVIDGDPNTGWAIAGEKLGHDGVSVDLVVAERQGGRRPFEMVLTFPNRHANHTIGKVRFYVSEQVITKPSDSKSTVLAAALIKPAKKRSKQDNDLIRKHYRSIDSQLATTTAAFRAAEKAIVAIAGPRATVMVMQERDGDPEPAYMLDRGQYDQPDTSEKLPRGVPEILLQENSSQPINRLHFAKWIVSKENPLTARVIVNRMWQDHFGVGLVKTSDDFGVQGDAPSHPELLDWLAVEFIESGWNIKAMHRLIVTSAAYRQSSRVSTQGHSSDPENRLVARGPRFRADGFTIRDTALQASGLLSEKVGGPSVKPYQPSGLWEVVAANQGTRYKPDKGQKLYRKSMYTYWKRAVNPPRQTIFDAGGREVCNVRVRRTNTPLQALVLLNDPTFVESARVLAQEVLANETSSDSDRIREMYRRVVAKPIDKVQLKILSESLAYFRKHYSNHPDKAKKLVSIGEATIDESLAPIELAANTAVAHVILNLDEFVTVE